MSGLGDSAEIAIVAGDHQERASGFLRESSRIVLKKIPAREAFGKIRRAVEHAIALIRPRHRKTNALDLRPSELVFGEEFFDTLDPPIDNRASAELGVGRALREVQADRRAILPNAGGFRGGRAAISSEKDFFHEWSLIFSIAREPKWNA